MLQYQLWFFQRRRGIEWPRITSQQSDFQGVKFLEVVNFPQDFAPLIREHYCTLKELDTYYSYEDALDMLEIWAVAQVNEQLVAQAYQSKIKR